MKYVAIVSLAAFIVCATLYGFQVREKRLQLRKLENERQLKVAMEKAQQDKQEQFTKRLREQLESVFQKLGESEEFKASIQPRQSQMRSYKLNEGVTARCVILDCLNLIEDRPTILISAPMRLEGKSDSQLTGLWEVAIEQSVDPRWLLLGETFKVLGENMKGAAQMDPTRGGKPATTTISMREIVTADARKTDSKDANRPYKAEVPQSGLAAEWGAKQPGDGDGVSIVPSPEKPFLFGWAYRRAKDFEKCAVAVSIVDGKVEWKTTIDDQPVDHMKALSAAIAFVVEAEKK
jgi:hypothetical protein